MLKKNYQFISVLQGTTLIELMLAITLSSLIFTSVISVYLVVQRNFKTQDSLNSIHENSEIAMHILTDNIRMAGYIGCAKLSNHHYLSQYLAYSLFPSTKIFGAKSYSDEITVRRINPKSAALATPAYLSSVIYASAKPRFKKEDVAVISDCKQAEIFQIKNIINLNGVQKIITYKPIIFEYAKNSEVSLFESSTYFIAKTQRKYRDKKYVYALFVKNNNSPQVELAEGIEGMQLTYDVMNNNKIHALKAEQVSDWSKVIGVAISLKVASVHDFSFQKMSFNYVALRQ